MTDLKTLASEAFEAYLQQGGYIISSTDQLAYLMLVATEVAEAAEAVRRGDSAPRVSTTGKPEGLPSELADIVLRVLIFAEALSIPLVAAIEAKHAYNIHKRPSLYEEGQAL